MTFNYNDFSKDLIKATICLVVIITAAILVGFGKLDINVFIVIISSVTSYYLGKTSDKGSIISN